MSNFARMFANAAGLRYGPPQQKPQPMQTGGALPPQMPMQTGGGAQPMLGYGAMQTGGGGQQQPMPMMQTGGLGQQWGQPMGMRTGGQSPMWPQPTSRLATLQQRFDQAPQWQRPGGFNYNRR